MKINNHYTITSNNGELFLVNVEDGDVYHINDVVQDILLNCPNEESIGSLVDNIYTKYENDKGTYSKADLEEFILSLIDKGIINV